MSQKRHKQMRRQVKASSVQKVPDKKINQKIIFVIIFSLILIFCFAMRVTRTSQSQQLQATDFQIKLDSGTSAVNYHNVSLTEAKQVFVAVINNLPDQQIRNSLIDLIRSGEWQVRYMPKGLFAIRFGEFFVNPYELIANRDKLGYLGSYLVHEHYHYQDWLGNNFGSENYHDCELEHYRSRICQLEWWDAEWRAVRAQAIFLQKYDYLNEMTTGPNVNNQAIFTQNDPDHAALEFIRINYYIGRATDSPELIQIFPEFFQNKLQEIN